MQAISSKTAFTDKQLREAASSAIGKRKGAPHLGTDPICFQTCKLAAESLSLLPPGKRHPVVSSVIKELGLKDDKHAGRLAASLFMIKSPQAYRIAIRVAIFELGSNGAEKAADACSRVEAMDEAIGDALKSLDGSLELAGVEEMLGKIFSRTNSIVGPHAALGAIEGVRGKENKLKIAEDLATIALWAGGDAMAEACVMLDKIDNKQRTSGMDAQREVSHCLMLAALRSSDEKLVVQACKLINYAKSNMKKREVAREQADCALPRNPEKKSE